MSTYPSWDDHLRMSDAEREQAATILGEHYAQGRLTTEEHSERLDLIWAAKTRAELAPIFRDLPGPGQPPPPRPAANPTPRSATRRRRRMPLPLMVLLTILVTIAVLTNLPLILVGLAVWFLLVRRGSCAPRSHRYPHARYPQARY